jgi:hypothetical protein
VLRVWTWSARASWGGFGGGLHGYEACGPEGGERFIPRGGDPPLERCHVAALRDVAVRRALMLDYARVDNERPDRMEPGFWITIAANRL